MDNCIFCKIANKEIPSQTVYEDDKCLAFLDIHPYQEGHTLLVPKSHNQWMTDVPDEELAYLFQTAKKIMKGLKTAMNADFVSLGVVGVDVPHFHIHLNPRYFNDRLRNTIPTIEYKNVEHMKEVADKIKNSL